MRKRRPQPALPPGSRRRGKGIQVNVYRGRDPVKGRDLYASATAHSPAEAWELWAKLKEQVASGEYVAPARQTVSQFLEDWLEKSVRPNVKPNTYRRYRSIVTTHLNPHLGKVRLQRLTPQHVETMLADLKGQVSDRTRLHVYRVLHRALEVAVRWKAVGRNVCDAVEPPRVDEPEMYVLSAEEVDRILQAVRGALLPPPKPRKKPLGAAREKALIEGRRRLYPLCLAAIHTGMRMGELLGLRWEDVDLEAGVAWVRQTLEKPGNQPVFGTPKNRKFREVPLTPELVEALKAHRVEQELERSFYAQDYQDYGLVFCQPDGRPIDQRSLNRNAWRQIKAAAGVPDKVRLHDLRHTFVSRALAAGANPRAVSDIVGHHDPGFTLRRYAHSLRSDREEATRRLRDYLSRTEKDPES